MSKKKKIAIIIATIILAPIALIIFIFGWEGSTADIRKVADQFQPPADWQLEDELVHPPKIMCLDGGTCPQVHRNWRTNGTSKEEINELLARTGWNISIADKDCDFHGAKGTSVPLCGSKGFVDNFTVSAHLTGDSNRPNNPMFTIVVRTQ